MTPKIKRTLLLFIFLFLSQAVISQEIKVPDFRNNPLPKNPKTLKILGIGNSFTVDGMEYLPDLLMDAGIENVTLGRLVKGGTSLEDHYTFNKNEDAVYQYSKFEPTTEGWIKKDEAHTFKQAIVDEDWDVIVIQQVSFKSGIYDTYQPFLNELLASIYLHCPNPGVSLAWQMTWAYGSEATHAGYVNYDKDQGKMYNAIMGAVQEMVVDTGIDIIIPSGTAVQNLRTTPVNNPPLDLTRDGYHMDLGAGRYLLACTWFQALVAPTLGVSVKGNKFMVEKGNIPVTEKNMELCQKAAQLACIRRFTVTPIE